jgi:tetratricopeptide (TPR) repeat protein
LQRVLARGLDPDPSARFASMDALLDALRDRPHPRRMAMLGALAVALVAAVAIAPGPAPVSTAARAMGPSFAALLGAGSRWAGARIKAATKPAFAALAANDPARATALAAELEASAAARGDELLINAASCIRGRALIASGELAAGRELVEASLARAQELGDDPGVVSAAIELVDLETTQGHLGAAEQWLRQGEAAAVRGDMPLDAIGWLEVRRAVLALRHGDIDGAATTFYGLIDLADPGVAGDPTRAIMLNNLGAIDGGSGDYRGAAEDFALALVLHEDTLPAGHPTLASTETNLGLALIKLGEHELGLAHVRAGLARVRGSLGSRHPMLVRAELGTASGFAIAGQLRACIAHARVANELARAIAVDPAGAIEALQLEAQCQLLLGDAARAELIAAASVTALEGTETGDDMAVRARFTYAQAAWQNGHREAAMREASRALVGTTDRETVTEIAKWLAHPTATAPLPRDPPR